MGVKLNTPRNLVNREATPKPVAEKAALRLNRVPPPEPEEIEDDPNAEDAGDENEDRSPRLKLS